MSEEPRPHYIKIHFTEKEMEALEEFSHSFLSVAFQFTPDNEPVGEIFKRIFMDTLICIKRQAQ